jgi:hypothetical protein
VSSGCRNLQKSREETIFFEISTTDLKIEKRKEKKKEGVVTGACYRVGLCLKKRKSERVF